MRLKLNDSFIQRHLAWLLVLVLLLPLAQTAANWHLLSHLRAEPSAQADGSIYALHQSHCDLCLTAVALTGGALPAPSLAALPLVAPAEAPAVPPSTAGFTRWLRPYESRAPPFVRF